mmetsp:Transcript_1391/g.3085  ORF Transcript_1391/g.3085 Transcript_1391/m.3085 type:complete len:257 (-) Transcript_1391:575-1345(-)
MPPSLPYSWKQMIRTSTGIIHNTSPQLPEQRGHIQCILSTLPPHGRAQWTQDIRQQLKRHRTARSEVHPEQSRITRDPGLEEEKVRPDHAAHDKLGASPHCHFGSIVGVKRLSGIVALLLSSIVIATGNSASLLRACSRRRCLRGIVRPTPKTRVGSTRQHQIHPQPRSFLGGQRREIPSQSVLARRVQRVQRRSTPSHQTGHRHDMSMPAFLPSIHLHDLLGESGGRCEVHVHEGGQCRVEIGVEGGTALVLSRV